MEQQPITKILLSENEYPEQGASYLTKGLLEIASSHVTLELLNSWAENPYDVTEEKSFRNLHATIKTLTDPDHKEHTYDDMTQLIGTITDLCCSIEPLADNAYDFLCKNMYTLDATVDENHSRDVDKIINLLSIADTDQSYEFITKHFAGAVVMSDNRSEFEWVLEDFATRKTNELVPSIVRGFARVLNIPTHLDPSVEKRVLEWTDLPIEFDENPTICQANYLTTLQEHVRRVVEMERVQPGMTEFLMDEYNISCFSRYPLELLTDQYNHRNNPPITTHGLIISALHDWNENTRTNGEDDMYSQFYDQVRSSNHELRIIEVAKKEDLFSLLDKVTTLHGELDFMIISAHGNQGGMRLGENFSDQFLARHLKHPESAAIFDALTPEGTIILGGCKLGKISGFAQKLSLRGHTVISSNDTSSLRTLLYFPEENPPIDLRFNKSKQTNIYKNGEIYVNQGERVW